MRPISALLQRGFDNAVANWPLMLISIAAQVAMIALFFGLFLLFLIPGVMIGVSLDWNDMGADPASFFETLILEHPFFVVYILVAIGIILIPVMFVYAFAEGAKYGVLHEGEVSRGAGGSRNGMRVFEPGKWLQWGRRTWWPAFWVLNIIWAIAFLVILFVMVFFGGLAFLVAMSGGEGGAGGAAAIGCMALLVLIPVFIFTAVVTNMVSQIAMSLLVRDGRGAVATLRAAMGFIRRHPGYSVGVTLLTIVVAFAIGGAFGGVGFVIQMGGEINESLLVMMLPLQIVFTLIQTAVTVVVQTWISAVFVSMVEGERASLPPSTEAAAI